MQIEICSRTCSGAWVLVGKQKNSPRQGAVGPSIVQGVRSRKFQHMKGIESDREGPLARRKQRERERGFGSSLGTGNQEANRGLQPTYTSHRASGSNPQRKSEAWLNN